MACHGFVTKGEAIDHERGSRLGLSVAPPFGLGVPHGPCRRQDLLRFKERIREQTHRARGISLTQMVQEIATYLRAWLGYFGDCQTPSVLQSLESWLRRRLRSVVWKQWKRGRKRYRELRKRDAGTDLAAQTARSPHGPWGLANSPAFNLALSNAYFAELVLPPMVARSQLNPPNRRTQTRIYGGVAGEEGRPFPLCRFLDGAEIGGKAEGEEMKWKCGRVWE